jgi:NAD(P)-dependent dehydrogenase (short-subunit alcohol dehydrogenase family)
MSEGSTSSPGPRVVVVGASSGLGRCIGIGLAQRGGTVALLARRKDRLESAAEESGDGSVAIACDVTEESSVSSAIEEAAAHLGGIDAVVYTPGIGTLGAIERTSQAAWRTAFDTNVIGASIVTAAALPHLQASSGAALYLSSVSASQTPPWPGLGPYAVSKAALDKMIDAWREEHPEVGFTRVVIGECAGGEGEAMTEFANSWDPEIAGDFVMGWVTKGYMTGALVDVQNVVHMVDTVVRSDPSLCVRSVTVAPRLVTPEAFPQMPES